DVPALHPVLVVRRAVRVDVTVRVVPEHRLVVEPGVLHPAAPGGPRARRDVRLPAGDEARVHDRHGRVGRVVADDRRHAVGVDAVPHVEVAGWRYLAGEGALVQLLRAVDRDREAVAVNTVDR